MEDSSICCFRESRSDACFLRDKLCEKAGLEEERKNNEMREKRKRSFFISETSSMS